MTWGLRPQFTTTLILLTNYSTLMHVRFLCEELGISKVPQLPSHNTDLYLLVYFITLRRSATSPGSCEYEA